MQGRAPRRPVEAAAQRLAVNRQNPGPVAAQIVRKDLEHPAKSGGVQQAEQAAERVMAGQAILEARKFAQQRLPVLAKLGKVHTGRRPANRRHKRNHQNVQKTMPLRIPRTRIRNRAQNLQQRCHPAHP